jgi:hypothetical protein
MSGACSTGLRGSSHGTGIGTGSEIVAMRPCGHRSGDAAPVREAAAYPGIRGNGAALNTPPRFERHSSKSANVQSSFLKFKAELAPEFFELHSRKVLGKHIRRVFSAINEEDVDVLALNLLTDVVEAYVNVF